MHHAQKRFLTSYAEGIKNLDRKNYEKAVVHLEDALVADPESEAAQEHLIGALYAEMGRITKRIDVIRKRLTKLNTSLKDEEINKKPITTKILIKFPAPQGLVDSEGLPRHLKRS